MHVRISEHHMHVPETCNCWAEIRMLPPDAPPVVTPLWYTAASPLGSEIRVNPVMQDMMKVVLTQ